MLLHLFCFGAKQNVCYVSSMSLGYIMGVCVSATDSKLYVGGHMGFNFLGKGSRVQKGWEPLV